MKKESYYDPRLAYMQQGFDTPTMPGLDEISSQLEAHNATAPDEKVKGHPLLSAGLGAGLGMGAVAGNAYLEGGEKHKDKASSVIAKYWNKKIVPHQFKAENSIYKKIRPVDAHLTENLVKSRKKVVKKMLDAWTTPEAAKKAGIKAMKAIPHSKLGLGAAAGGGLAYLANKLLSEKKEQ